MNQDYIKLDHGSDEYKKYFVVNWCFFSICNFSCSYCPEVLHDGKNRGLDIEIVKKFCQNIIESKKDKKVFFEFTGGEMTYYRSFVELFTYLKASGAETGLISNGSRTLEFWESHKGLIDHICLSFHPEQGDAEHFFDVVKLLNEVTTVHVNIMMLPEKFDHLYDLAKRISSQVEGISLAIQPLFENMSGGMFKYTEDQKNILDNQTLPWGSDIKFLQSPNKVKKIYRGEMKKIFNSSEEILVNPPELIARQENNWYGWQCHIGLENIVVDFNGNVLRGWCRVGGILGNIQDSNFSLPSKPITCSVKNCYCGLDIMATKVKAIPSTEKTK